MRIRRILCVYFLRFLMVLVLDHMMRAITVDGDLASVQHRSEVERAILTIWLKAMGCRLLELRFDQSTAFVTWPRGAVNLVF